MGTAFERFFQACNRCELGDPEIVQLLSGVIEEAGATASLDAWSAAMEQQVAATPPPVVAPPTTPPPPATPLAACANMYKFFDHSMRLSAAQRYPELAVSAPTEEVASWAVVWPAAEAQALQALLSDQNATATTSAVLRGWRAQVGQLCIVYEVNHGGSGPWLDIYAILPQGVDLPDLSLLPCRELPATMTFQAPGEGDVSFLPDAEQAGTRRFTCSNRIEHDG
jgi:hypothetical protein